jgi:sugar phosphate isomerase/epimerase
MTPLERRGAAHAVLDGPDNLLHMIDNLDHRLAVCSWSLRPDHCDDLIDKVRQCGLSAVQLHLDPIAENKPGWAGAGAKLRHAGIRAISGMIACVGEDYSTIARIEETGGVVPDATWPDTQRRMNACMPVAHALGLKLVTFHAGFIPHDVAAPIRAKVKKRISQLAMLFGERGISIGLETGQESAATLLGFLGEVGQTNVGVNFDPANMLLYGSGEPIAALRELADKILQVHLKDAIPSAVAGEWGSEEPLGEGQVDWRAFFGVLADIGYTGALPIEREAGNDRIGDVKAAARYAEAL